MSEHASIQSAEAPGSAGTILVVDDSPIHAHLAARLAEKALGLRSIFAQDGIEALDQLKQKLPLIVLTDLMMPRMDGLELVQAVVQKYPDLPIILMTAQGSEEIASQALKYGAASYVPKGVLSEQLGPVLERVLTLSRQERQRSVFLRTLTHFSCSFALGNDETLIPLFIQHMQLHLESMQVIDAKRRVRISVALEEALLNAMYHGNLEVSSNLKEQGKDQFAIQVKQRQQQSPYKDRKVLIHCHVANRKATIIIRDEGSGFDVASLPDPTDPENILKPCGRGMLLIRTFVDEVKHNKIGNEITLIICEKCKE